MLHDARLHGPFVGERHTLARLDDDERLIQQWGEALRAVTGARTPGRTRARGSAPAAAVGYERAQRACEHAGRDCEDPLHGYMRRSIVTAMFAAVLAYSEMSKSRNSS